MTKTEQDLHFDRWMKRVDIICENTYGMDTASFCDYNWRDLFDDGISPSEAFDDWCCSDYSPEAF